MDATSAILQSESTVDGCNDSIGLEENWHQTKIVTYEWAEYIKRANHGEHDALILGIVSSIPEPDLWLGGRAFGTTTRNDYSFSRWSSVLFDDLIDRATQTL